MAHRQSSIKVAVCYLVPSLRQLGHHSDADGIATQAHSLPAESTLSQDWAGGRLRPAKLEIANAER